MCDAFVQGVLTWSRGSRGDDGVEGDASLAPRRRVRVVVCRPGFWIAAWARRTYTRRGKAGARYRTESGGGTVASGSVRAHAKRASAG